METEGLKSLNKRIRKLESQNITDDEDLIDILQRRQKQNKKHKLNELNEIYLTNLLDKVQNISKDNFFNVLKFTIEFINQNISQISSVLQTKPSEELSNLVIMDFINRLYTGEFSEEFLTVNIDGIKTLMNTSKLNENCCSSEKCECINCGCKKDKDKKKSFFKK
jgi:hypothetical protein